MHTRATITHRARRPGAPESISSIQDRRTIYRGRREHSQAIRGELSAPEHYLESQGVETTSATASSEHSTHNYSRTRHARSIAPALRRIFGLSGTPTAFPARVVARPRHRAHHGAARCTRSD